MCRLGTFKYLHSPWYRGPFGKVYSVAVVILSLGYDFGPES